MRAVRPWLLAALLVGAACKGPDGGWGPGDAKASEEEAEEQPTPVVVTTVKAGPISATISAASTIEAERQVTVHAESTGRLLELQIEEGDRIEGGKSVGRIKYDAQAAMLDRASSSLDKAKTDLETAEALYAKRVLSKEELDAARLAYEQATLDVRDSRRDIRNTRVMTPFGGTVAERFANEGSFVTSGQQLFSLVDMSTLVARVYVPEKELDRIAVGQPAEIVGKAAKGRKGTGVIERIAPIVDAATGTVKVTIALPEELAGGDEGFLPGMYAEVMLTTEQRERVTLVPKETLVHKDDQAFLFVVQGDRAKRTAVETGLEDDRHIQIVSGVSVGDEVISAGHAGLKDGGLIRRVDPSGEPIEASAPDGEGLAERSEDAEASPEGA